MGGMRDEWKRRVELALARAADDEKLLRVIAQLEPLTARFELLEGGVTGVRIDPLTGVTAIADVPDPDVVISGDARAWNEVLSGETPYVRQVNVKHGRFSAQGSVAHSAWLMPVFSAIFSGGSGSEGELESPPSPAPGVVHGRYLRLTGGQAYVDVVVGEGPAVLLIHTAGRDARQWHPLMAELAGEFALYAPDLPGRGRSEADADGYLDDVQRIAEWLMAVADALELGSYVVAGCSLGGNLALLLGAVDPRVQGVLALQGADLTPTISAASLAAMDHPRISLPHANMNFTMSLVGSGAGDRQRAALRRGVDTLNAPAQLSDLSAYTRCDIRDRMAEIECPVILFRGEDDWVVDSGMIAATASRIVNASTLEVRSVPEVGHFPHVEQPELVAVALRDLVGAPGRHPGVSV